VYPTVTDHGVRYVMPMVRLEGLESESVLVHGYSSSAAVRPDRANGDRTHPIPDTLGRSS